MAMNDRLKLINKMRKELAKAIGAKIKDVELLRDDGETVELEADGGEYSIVETYDIAERVAKERVLEDLDNEPEIFTQSWLQQFMTVSDTDRRIIAGEEAYHRLEDMDEEEIVKEADREDEWDEIQEKEDELDDEADDYDSELKKIEKEREILVKESRVEVESKIYDEWYDGLEDPVRFLCDEQGLYSREELFKQSFISLDKEDAADDAINTDGAGHFLSSYDGELNETESGFAYWRTN